MCRLIRLAACLVVLFLLAGHPVRASAQTPNVTVYYSTAPAPPALPTPQAVLTPRPACPSGACSATYTVTSIQSRPASRAVTRARGRVTVRWRNRE